MTGRLVETIEDRGVTLEVWRFPSIADYAWRAHRRLLDHFAALDGDPADEPTPIPGQLTVEEALADASLPLQEGRCRDGRTKTDTK